MSLKYGIETLSIPGPSVFPDRVLRAMHRRAPNIYEGELIELTETLYPDLKRVACTKGDVAIYIGNGHAAWEATLANTVAAGDKVLVLNTGRFAQGWGTVAKTLGIEVVEIDFGKRDVIDLDQAEAALRADKNHDFKAVLITQTDTASSVSNDVEAFGKMLRETGHPALFMVDCMASLGTEEHQMDYWGVDVMMSGSQKGLMTPPGLCFVWFNEKAKEARKNLDRVSYYWDWTPRVEAEYFYQKFAGTAPTNHLYGLRMALDMILKEEGLENVWKRHDQIARAIWAALDSWEDGGALYMNVENPDHRSKAVTAVTAPNRLGHFLQTNCRDHAGVTLGVGLGMADRLQPEFGDYFRIGHMGHVNAHMIMGTLGAIDMGLKAENIPHGQDALANAAAILAEK